MNLSYDINAYLDKMNLFICNYDKKNKKIVYAFFKNELVISDATFEDFFKRLCNYFLVNYDKQIMNDLLRFICDDNVDKMSFFAYSNHVKAPISLIKTKISDDNVGLIFENLNDKKDLLEYLDPLTEVLQKHAFINYIKQRYEKDKTPYTLMIMDIDNFKGINDNYGHNVGDEILKNVARVLKKTIKNGVIARYGGDEFVCASYQSTQFQDVWNLLYKITHDIYDAGILFDNPIDVSITAGVSRFGIDGNNFEDLFIKADRALYRGKRKGKNCFIIYDEEKHKNIQVDGENRTIIDDRNENYSITQIISYAYDLINKDYSYSDIMKSLTEYITDLYNVDRCVIYLTTLDNLEYPAAYYYRDGKGKMSTAKRAYMNWKDHEKNNVVSFIQVSNLKEYNLPLYESLTSEGIKSVLRKELKLNDNNIGAIEIDSFSERDWSIEEKNALIILGEFLSVYLYKVNENMIIEYKSVIDNVSNTLKYERFISYMSSDLENDTKKKVLYYINLTKFKLINDLFSYKTGDILLKKTADLIKKIFKVKDMITRINGDRFLVYTDFTSVEDIYDNFNSLDENLKKTEFPNNGIKDYINLSCGVYVTDGIENSTASIIDNANIARKILKDKGEKGILIYSSDVASEYQFKRDLESYFSNALREEEFKIYLQPKVDITSGKVVGAEALSRWFLHNDKIIHPADYIPILETTKQIEQLDLYVFEHVCDYLSKIMELGKKMIPISINVSRSVTNLFEYVDELERIRIKYDIPPKYLQIEITESMVNEENNLANVINKLHSLGYSIAVDDFGSGYSNLQALTECRFDVLKLDRTLCTDGSDARKDAVLDIAIKLAAMLGISVLCEGVETKAQENNLLLKDIRVVQGFLYDRPISLSDFTNKYL